MISIRGMRWMSGLTIVLLAACDDGALGTGAAGGASSTNPSAGTDAGNGTGKGAGTESNAATATGTTTGIEMTPLGEGESATPSSFADLNVVPFDANRDDLVGPTAHDAQYGRAPAIVAVPGPDYLDVAVQSTAAGGETVIVRLRADAAGKWGVTRTARPMTLGRLMGLARGANEEFFYATGTFDEGITTESPAEGEYRADVVRVIKLKGKGDVIFDQDLDPLREAAGMDHLVRPMVASSSRIAATDAGVFLLHGGNTDPDGNGTRHQAAYWTALDPTSGAIVDAPGSWVSHSFDQRILTEGSVMYLQHLGDAYPRSLVVTRTDFATGEQTTVEPCAFKGNLGDNNTFARLGNLVKTTAGDYLMSFATERETDMQGEGKIFGTRELALVRLRVDGGVMTVDDTFGTPQVVNSAGAERTNHVVFLTDYASAHPRDWHVERPRLIPLGDGTFVALYEKWNDEQFIGTFAMRVDGAGAIQMAETAVGSSHLPRGDDAFAFQGGAAWITGDSETRKLTLHVVDASLQYTAHETL